MSNLVDETTIRKFVTALHAHASAALGDTGDLLHLSTLLPDAGSLCTQAFEIGDVEGMVKAAVTAAEGGRNVFTEGRSVAPGLPSERGKIGATRGVFALVVDRDSDTGKAGRALNGDASMVVETSPGNTHEWLFLEACVERQSREGVRRRNPQGV